MKVLLNPICVATPHFETELEIIKNHVDSGDEIYVLMCKGDLHTCFMNSGHTVLLCVLCQSRCRKGLKLFKNRVTILTYPFSQKLLYHEIPQVFPDIDSLKNFKLQSAPLGLCATSSLVTRMNREHRLDTIKSHKEVAIEINTAFYVYNIFHKVLSEVKPDIVYLFNGRFSTVFPGLLACEEIGIPYYTHERGGSKNRYWTGKNVMPHDIENMTIEMEKVWENYTDEEQKIQNGSRAFIAKRESIEQSWYSYVKDQNKNLLPNGFDKSKKNIVIFNSTIEESVAIRCIPNQLIFYKDEIELVSSICNSLKNFTNYQIYLRIHPNLKGYDNSQTRDLFKLNNQFSNLKIIPAESQIDSYALLDNSTAIITFGSTVGVEACFWGKPSISLGRAAYENLNCTYNPKSHAEVIKLLLQELPPKPQIGAIKYGLWELERGVPFKYFKPSGIFSGVFMGKKIQPARIFRIWYLIDRVFKIKNPITIARLFLKRLGFFD